MMTIDEAIRHCEEIAEKCDLISEASKTIKAHISYRKCAEEHKQLAEWLKELQRYQWIPCSESLPEKQTTVLYSLEGCVSVAFMTDRNYTGETVELHWEDLETGITIYPEAWIPLPEPYEPKEEDE